MLKPVLRVCYRNFWPGFDPECMPQDHFFEFALSRQFNVLHVAHQPDLVIYSVFGAPPRRDEFPGSPLLVGYSGEPVDAGGAPDLCFGFDPRPRPDYLRLPLWALYLVWDETGTPYRIADRANLGQGSHSRAGTATALIAGDAHPLRTSAVRSRVGAIARQSHFCNFTYRNSVPSRVDFFERLSRYRRVDSTGALLNNTGYRIVSKVHELGAYRFTMAFENTIRPGYVTEKLLEPLAAGSVPIYLGAREACSDFNPDAFIHALDFEGPEQLMAHIRALDLDDVRYQVMLSAPVFRTLPNYPVMVCDAIAARLGGQRPDDAVPGLG